MKELDKREYFSKVSLLGRISVQPKAILKRIFVFLRKLASFYIEIIQSLSVYRKVARWLRSGIEIKEAGEEELHNAHIWLHPKGTRIPTERSNNVTTFVAKKREKIIGFVELVRHLEEGHPFKGYWVFSLTIRVLFRGMGIGELLGWKVVHRAVEEGAEEIFFLMRKDNKRIINLCRKHGAEMKVIPGVEELLEKEKDSLGYRRVVMSRSLLGIVFEEKYLKG